MEREERTERTALRMTPTEARMIQELAAATGLSASDVMRQAVRRWHAERFGEPANPTTTKRPKRK